MATLNRTFTDQNALIDFVQTTFWNNADHMSDDFQSNSRYTTVSGLIEQIEETNMDRFRVYFLNLEEDETIVTKSVVFSR